jgi:SAM-dependent methyltransferase
MAMKAAFESIYDNGVWAKDAEGRGTSGPVTEFGTKLFRTLIEDFLKGTKSKSVVDAGCGDWQLARSIDWTGIDYRGFDIVADVIDRNKQRFEKPNVHFFVANVVDDDLPPADLLLCSWVLQHLSNADVARFLAKQLPKYRHVIIANSVDPSALTAANRDIKAGDFRFLDVTKPPFSLPGAKVLTYLEPPHMQQIVYLKGHP